MTVTDMVRFMRERELMESKKNAPSNEEQIAEHLRKTGQEGFYVRQGDTSYRKIIPVDESVKNKILEQDKKEFIMWNGMNKCTTKIPDMIYEYAKTRKPEDRLAASWTLSRAVQEQGSKFIRIVRQHNPNWNYGDPFDPKILDEPHIDEVI